LWAWGQGGNGQLGDGNLSSKNVPTQESTGANDWVKIAAGNNTTFAIKSDGSLWGWGWNGSKQLGIENTEYESIPTRIGSDTWLSIDIYDDATFGIKSDGTLWGWGWNNCGRISGAAPEEPWHYPIPTQLGTDNDWSSVSVGWTHTAAIKTEGSLWVWGCNSYGQLGLYNTDTKYVPTKQTFLDSASDQIGVTWTSVETGQLYTAALRSDGGLYLWGSNSKGQIGNNQVGGYIWGPNHQGGDWSAITVGHQHTAAIKSDGTLWTWGYNGLGQLGIGNETPSYYSASCTCQRLPTQIGTGTNWSDVSAGYSHTAVIESAAPFVYSSAGTSSYNATYTISPMPNTGYSYTYDTTYDNSNGSYSYANVVLDEGENSFQLTLQAPENASPANWSIRNAENCSWLKWPGMPVSGGPINGSVTIQGNAQVNNQGNFDCPVDIRIGYGSDLYGGNAQLIQSFRLTFVWSNWY
jgi:alpha-tubulin suppressor-like RCC1 family protein